MSRHKEEKMKKNHLHKMVASILAATMLLGIIPSNVIADSLEDKTDEIEVQDAFHQYAPEDFVQEITEKRSEYSKTYERGDGTYTTILSADPVHYKDNGDWQEIDNSLSLVLIDGEQKYVNKQNDMKVELPSRMSTEEELSISKDTNKISFKLMNEINSVPACISNNKSLNKSLPNNENDLKSKIGSSVPSINYQDVRQNTDISYDILPNGVKESIVLYEKPYNKLRFVYQIYTGDLEAKHLNDNTIEFFDSVQELKFKMPAPVMFDSSSDKMQLSDKIDISLNYLEKGVYELIYQPDMTWFESQLSYPVTIDPTILTDKYYSIEDVSLKKDHPDSSIANSPNLDWTKSTIRQDDVDNSSVYLEIRNLPDIPKESLKSAKLYYHTYKTTGDWNTCDCSTIEENSSPETKATMTIYDAFTMPSMDIKDMTHNNTTIWSREYIFPLVPIQSTANERFVFDFTETYSTAKNYSLSCEPNDPVKELVSSRGSRFKPFVLIDHYADDTFPNDTKVNIRSTPTAVFEDQNIIPINDKSQLTATFDKVSLLFSESAQRLGGFLTFHDGDTTMSYYFAHYICQSHLDITGNRSLVAGVTNYPIDQGYVLTNFRIEENCDSLTLMPANQHLEGKTVVSIGLLNKATNNMYYMQQELEGLSFDTLYQKAVPSDNDYAFKTPNNLAISARASNDSNTDLGAETEKAYLFLKQQTGVESGDIVNPEPDINQAMVMIDTESNEVRPMFESSYPFQEPKAITVDNMRNNLITLQNKRVATTDPNSQSGLPYLSHMSSVSYPVPHQWTYHWVGFKSTDSAANKLHPYFYAIYGFQLAGTDNNVATIMLLDFSFTNQGMHFSMSAQVSANMDIAYNTKSKQLTVWEMTRGNAIIEDFYMGQHSLGSPNLKYIDSSAKTQVTRPPNIYDLLPLAKIALGFLTGGASEIGGILINEFTTAKQLYEAAYIADSKPVGPDIEHSVSGKCSHNTITCRHGHLYAPDGKIGDYGEISNSDFATLTGTVNIPGEFYTRYFYCVKVACIVYGKYDY